MKISNLKTYVYHIAGFDNKQATSPPGAYQAQGISRCNPAAIPFAIGGSIERKLGAGKIPGGASLRCGECDRFIKWIGKSELAKFNQGGRI